MDDTRLNLAATPKPLIGQSNWIARLDLKFARQQQRSFLAFKQHHGPLVLQKSLHPEGPEVCHGVIVHPPGGVAGGDELTLHATLAPAAHALLTTPGAGKWYKANGQTARQHLAFTLADSACMEWLPQENILFDGAQVAFSARIELDKTAQFAGWEILCFGRQAQKERWLMGRMHQNLAIYRAGTLIWKELGHFSPSHPVMHALAGLRGNAVSASFVVAAGQVPAEVLSACRAVVPDLALDLQASYGVTALPEVFSARYVGQSAQSARHYFEQLWCVLRPWYAGRQAVRPRIWNT